MRERRGAARIDLTAKVTATVLEPEVANGSKKNSCTGWTQDVSLGGLNLRTRKSLPLHARLDLDVHCEHPIETVHLRGRVGWVRQESGVRHTVGVFLDETSKDDLVAWRRMLERRGLPV
ncbi:MAG: PilZ domain-containing protein [Verrucomicrobia bacterium]|nr:PilZ domain-containing protein [Verrucomicrobiota bacterium]